MNSNKPLLFTEDICRLLGVNARKIPVLVRMGLKAFKIPGTRGYRCLPEDIRSFAELQRVRNIEDC